ncbi:MAG: cob(I)yrinic acid a,c-diamide adenosyltransferase [Spirochaetales bacterium]|nr:cob(I)yrinic acid a,c-diamide adenosyltransferase [Spirochaetales bacterium]
MALRLHWSAMEQGKVQIYTGDGKGKTTAALGLALRACGSGLHVYIAQFAKGMHYGELDALARFADLITIRQFGRACFIHNQPTDEDRRVAREGWAEVQRVIEGQTPDLLVLDEIGIAIYYGLVSEEEVRELIRRRPAGMELVLTGRKVPAGLFELADLVTEMREIKHYYREGLLARRGIEF